MHTDTFTPVHSLSQSFRYAFISVDLTVFHHVPITCHASHKGLCARVCVHVHNVNKYVCPFAKISISLQKAHTDWMRLCVYVCLFLHLLVHVCAWSESNGCMFCFIRSIEKYICHYTKGVLFLFSMATLMHKSVKFIRGLCALNVFSCSCRRCPKSATFWTLCAHNASVWTYPFYWSILAFPTGQRSAAYPEGGLWPSK